MPDRIHIKSSSPWVSWLNCNHLGRKTEVVQKWDHNCNTQDWKVLFIHLLDVLYIFFEDINVAYIPFFFQYVPRATLWNTISQTARKWLTQNQNKKAIKEETLFQKRNLFFILQVKMHKIVTIVSILIVFTLASYLWVMLYPYPPIKL